MPSVGGWDDDDDDAGVDNWLLTGCYSQEKDFGKVLIVSMVLLNTTLAVPAATVSSAEHAICIITLATRRR